ncbi:MAG: T9SS type A sorting domain-containing protein [Chitinophagales bacterium]|nr:T9SS type A sorting domain-containing protein [Chitinophagales bacterium]
MDTLKLFPNPALKLISVTRNNSRTESWEITDITGRYVMAGKPTGDVTTIDISILTPAVISFLILLMLLTSQ